MDDPRLPTNAGIRPVSGYGLLDPFSAGVGKARVDDEFAVLSHPHLLTGFKPAGSHHPIRGMFNERERMLNYGENLRQSSENWPIGSDLGVLPFHRFPDTGGRPLPRPWALEACAIVCPQQSFRLGGFRFARCIGRCDIIRIGPIRVPLPARGGLCISFFGSERQLEIQS